MTDATMDYDNFAALLTRIVTTPKAVTDAREKELEDVKAWRKKHGMKATRQRLSASPSPAVDAKPHPTSPR